MKTVRFLALGAAVLAMASCSENNQSVMSLPEASESQVVRVEPLCWWTGMKTPLQLLIGGPEISAYDVRLEGISGVSVKEIHKADSPNYLFADVTIKDIAEPGTCQIVFSKDGKDEFRRPFEILAREKGSASRKSFTTDDMIYLIFPDRFSNGDPSNDSTEFTTEGVDREDNNARHGGDIQGIINHLDYVAGLGATAIWCTPMLLDNAPRGSYHGYACDDYYHIDPRFGSNELYREMVSKAHEKGLKVIMDIVTNHCGTEHWWMADPPFKDWIHHFDEYTQTNAAFSTQFDPNAYEYDRNIEESGWFVPSMPDINLDNPFTLKYFQQWAIWWVEYAGLDGFRVDTYPYNEKEPMSEWCEAVLEEYPNFNIVGECWTGAPDQLAYWQGGNPNADGFDSHLPSIMDFPLWGAMTGAVASAGSQNPGEANSMRAVYDALSHDFIYHDLSHMMIFAANHDHSRLGDVFGHDPRKLKMALTMVATMRGIPQLYNGDEMMFSARNGEWSDGAKRIDFPGGWDGDEVNLFTPEGRASAQGAYSSAAELHDFTAKLFNWRKTSEPVRHGRTLHFIPQDNCYAYFRYTDDKAVFVFINASAQDRNIPWNHYAEFASGPVDGTEVISGEKCRLSDSTVVPAMSEIIVEFAR
jgi:glycosidase